MKSLSDLHIQDINGSWEVAFGNNKTIWQFTNKHLTKRPFGRVATSEHADVHQAGNITRLVVDSGIFEIELFNDKFMILKKDGGHYLLFVKILEY